MLGSSDGRVYRLQDGQFHGGESKPGVYYDSSQQVNYDFLDSFSCSHHLVCGWDKCAESCLKEPMCSYAIFTGGHNDQRNPSDTTCDVCLGGSVKIDYNCSETHCLMYRKYHPSTGQSLRDAVDITSLTSNGQRPPLLNDPSVQPTPSTVPLCCDTLPGGFQTPSCLAVGTIHGFVAGLSYDTDPSFSPPPPAPSPPSPELPPPPAPPGTVQLDTCECMCFAEEEPDAPDMTETVAQARAVTPLPHSVMYAARAVLVRGLSMEVDATASFGAIANNNDPSDFLPARNRIPIPALRINVAFLAKDKRQRVSDGGVQDDASTFFWKSETGICPYAPTQASEFGKYSCLNECATFCARMLPYTLAYLAIEFEPNADSMCRCYVHRIPVGTGEVSYFTPNDQQAMRWLDYAASALDDGEYGFTGVAPFAKGTSYIYLAHRRPPGSERTTDAFVVPQMSAPESNENAPSPPDMPPPPPPSPLRPLALPSGSVFVPRLMSTVFYDLMFPPEYNIDVEFENENRDLVSVFDESSVTDEATCATACVERLGSAVRAARFVAQSLESNAVTPNGNGACMCTHIDPLAHSFYDDSHWKPVYGTNVNVGLVRWFVVETCDGSVPLTGGMRWTWSKNASQAGQALRGGWCSGHPINLMQQLNAGAYQSVEESLPDDVGCRKRCEDSAECAFAELYPRTWEVLQSVRNQPPPPSPPMPPAPPPITPPPFPPFPPRPPPMPRIPTTRMWFMAERNGELVGWDRTSPKYTTFSDASVNNMLHCGSFLSDTSHYDNTTGDSPCRSVRNSNAAGVQLGFMHAVAKRDTNPWRDGSAFNVDVMQQGLCPWECKVCLLLPNPTDTESRSSHAAQVSQRFVVCLCAAQHHRGAHERARV